MLVHGSSRRRLPVRVIAGAARGRRLASVPGTGTRPITDRAKEALFSILGDRIEGAAVLDLFAGTGAVGIEALSRGACWCDFVDTSAGAVRTIAANLEQTGLAGRARIWRRDVFQWLDRPPAGHRGAYDLIYVAPPQYRGMWSRALRALTGDLALLAPEGRVVTQIHPREDEELATPGLAVIDRRRYGGVLLVFRARSDSGEECA